MGIEINTHVRVYFWVILHLTSMIEMIISVKNINHIKNNIDPIRAALGFSDKSFTNLLIYKLYIRLKKIKYFLINLLDLIYYIFRWARLSNFFQKLNYINFFLLWQHMNNPEQTMNLRTKRNTKTFNLFYEQERIQSQIKNIRIHDR